MGDPTPVPDRIISLIKRTGNLVALAHTHLWAADEVPKDLQSLIDELQSLGKALTGLKTVSEADIMEEFPSSVIQKLNTPSGPLAECAAELKRLHLKLDSSNVRDQGVDVRQSKTSSGKILILPNISRIEKHTNVLVLALQLVSDQS